MKKNDALLTTFIIVLTIAAFCSAFLHTVEMFLDKGVAKEKAIAVFCFVAIVEALRGVFVVANTRVRRINHAWGVAMIFGSLIITAGLAMFAAEDPESDFFWLLQVYNVLILFSEWSVSTVLSGFNFDWSNLTEDLKDVHSLEKKDADLSFETKIETLGKIDWNTIPRSLNPLKKVIEDLHKHIHELNGKVQNSEDLAKRLKQASEKVDLFDALVRGTSITFRISNEELDSDYKRLRREIENGKIAGGKWISTGGTKKDYLIICQGKEGFAPCPPFLAPRSKTEIYCPSCGLHHDRATAQIATQMIRGTSSDEHKE